jgi:hypothetical protein
MPEWSDWFAEELRRYHAVSMIIGIGCAPAVIKATKEQLLDWLSWGVESEAVGFPAESGPIPRPTFSLKNIFLRSG